MIVLKMRIEYLSQLCDISYERQRLDAANILVFELDTEISLYRHCFAYL